MEMPRFEDELTDDELAALANFSIRNFGHRPGRVTAADVWKARREVWMCWTLQENPTVWE
jgi:hypothetical protein